MTRRRRIAAAALLALALIAAAATTGALPLWSNDVPEVGVEVYFEPGAGELSTLAAADLVVTGEVMEVGESRWNPEADLLPWERDLIDGHHPVELRIDRVIGRAPNQHSPANGSFIIVWVFGGRLDDEAEEDSTDAARFEEGERVPVFLNEVRNSSHCRVPSFTTASLPSRTAPRSGHASSGTSGGRFRFRRLLTP